MPRHSPNTYSPTTCSSSTHWRNRWRLCHTSSSSVLPRGRYASSLVNGRPPPSLVSRIMSSTRESRKSLTKRRIGRKPDEVSETVSGAAPGSGRSRGRTGLAALGCRVAGGRGGHGGGGLGGGDGVGRGWAGVGLRIAKQEIRPPATHRPAAISAALWKP